MIYDMRDYWTNFVPYQSVFDDNDLFFSLSYDIIYTLKVNLTFWYSFDESSVMIHDHYKFMSTILIESLAFEDLSFYDATR